MRKWSAFFLSTLALLLLVVSFRERCAAANDHSPPTTDHNRGLKTLDLWDVQVSTELANDNKPRIARYEDRVYAVWYRNGEVSLGISTDGGAIWESSAIITGTRPAIAVDTYGNLHITYDDSHQVYYTTSEDGGQTFSSPLSLGNGCGPDIAVNAGGNPYIVWQEEASVCGDTGVDQVTNIVLSRIEEHDLVSLGTTITKTVVSTTTLGFSE